MYGQEIYRVNLLRTLLSKSQDQSNSTELSSLLWYRSLLSNRDDQSDPTVAGIILANIYVMIK